MVKYWIDYVSNRGNNTVGYRSLEGFITDIISWVQEDHDDPEEQLYIYEEHNKNEGFYVTLEDISRIS